jgi:hypothetical protein
MEPTKAIVSEAKAVCAMTILDALYCGNKPSTKHGFYDQLYNSYHGHKGMASQIDLFQAGAPPYDSLFVKNATANTSRDGVTEQPLFVPRYLTRRDDVNVTVDKTLTQQTMERSTLSGPKEISGLFLMRSNSKRYLAPRGSCD